MDADPFHHETAQPASRAGGGVTLETRMDRIVDGLLVASGRSRPGFLARLVGHGALRRSRRALLDLDPRLLEDVGVTRHEALQEGRQPAWDAPAHWRR